MTGQRLVDLSLNEHLCPMCRRLCNTVIQVSPTALQPLPAASSTDAYTEWLHSLLSSNTQQQEDLPLQAPGSAAALTEACTEWARHWRGDILEDGDQTEALVALPASTVALLEWAARGAWVEHTHCIPPSVALLIRALMATATQVSHCVPLKCNPRSLHQFTLLTVSALRQ